MRSHSKALFAVAALLAFLSLAPLAQAAPKNVAQTIGHAGNDAGGFMFPMGVGINQATGDVYVSDGDCCSFSSGGHRVLQFSAAGDFIRAWGWGVATGADQFEVCTTTCQRAIRGSGDGQFSLGLEPTPPQVAVNQSDGSVYVVDNLNDRIQKFSSTGAFLGKFGAAGSGDGQFDFPSGVAVDPVSDDVYVADSNNNRIQRFDSSGAFKSQVGEPGSDPGQFANPTHLAVDSTGRLYVIDQGNGRIQRFTDTGTFDQVFAADLISFPTLLTIDPANDHVYVAGQSPDSSVGGIFEFDAAGSLIDVHAANSGINGFPAGLAVRSSTGRIYASSPATPTAVMVLDHVNAPTAAIDPVTTFDSDSATLRGEVSSNGIIAANWRFQISTDSGATWANVGAQGTVPEGSTAHQVSVEATGLEPNTHYDVQLVASKSFIDGQVIDSTSFTTEAAPPRVQALYPGPITHSSAWLGAFVNPKNSPTTFYVEYSTDPGFASSVSVPVTEDASAGSEGQLTLANQLVSGLQSQTTYHYRVIATSEAGTTTGESRSFTTTAVLPPPQGLPDDRVWEKVSPAEKGGANVNAGNFELGGIGDEVAQAAVDGNAVTFGSEGKFVPGEGAPITTQYLTRRGASGGWQTEAVNPQMDPAPGISQRNYFQWFSDDLSKGVVTTYAALNPSDPNETYNLYLRDNNTGSYMTLSQNEGSIPTGVLSEFRGASQNGQHFVFQTTDLGLTAANSVLMERTLDGVVRPASVLTDGSVIAGSLDQDGGELIPGFNAVSDDGSRIFFSPTTGKTESAIYVREDGESTNLVSGSERAGDDPNAPKKGDFLGASSDGSIAYFRSSEQLTDEALASGGKSCIFEDESETRPAFLCYLYRWEADAPTGERLTNLTLGDPEGTQVLGIVGLSDDGSSIYFAAFGNLDGNGSPLGPNLYHWDEDHGIEHVARLKGGGPNDSSDLGLWNRWNELIKRGPGTGGDDNNEPYKPARVSPDGRYLAFSTHVPQTAYDTNGKQAIYIYDSETGRVTCVSCGSVESKSKGDAWFVSCASEEATETRCKAMPYLSRNLRADGGRLIFDSKDALVPSDTNGVTDVYEWQDGRLHLLSSGTSAFASRFVDASASGDDVFFTTAQQLTLSDKDDLRDLYDARVGGTPEPDVTPPCVADECQGTPKPAPSFQTPSSSGFKGAGDATRGRPRCAKAKVRRKGRCVKRRASKQAKRAKNKRTNADRRAGK